ncbi:MAG: DUF4129 domain-containing protein [Polyangiales bacterium]
MIGSSSRDIALRVGWALIEALAIAAVAVSVTATLPAGAPRLGAAPLLALMTATALVGGTSVRLPVRPLLGRLIALLITALLAFAWVAVALPDAPSRVALTSLSLLALGVTGRGLLLGFHEPAHADVLRAFLRGAVVLMLMFWLMSLAHVPVDDALGSQLRALVLGYFAFGPMVVALAQRRTLRRTRGVRAPLSASWWLAVLAPILGVLALAVIASAGKQGLNEGLGVAMHGAGIVVALGVQGLAWAGHAGVLALTWLARLFPGGGSRHAPPPPLLPRELPDEPLLATPPPPLTVAQHDIASAVLLVTMVLFAALYVSKLLRAAEGPDDPFGDDEERTSLWSWKLFSRQARDLLRALLSQARTRVHDAVRRPEPFRVSTDLSDVRGVYRALLQWAAHHGRPRTPTTTPHELAERIAGDDGERAHVDAITALYTEARYGEHAVAPAQLAEARTHLDALTDRATASRRTRDPDAAPETDRTPSRR